MASVLLNLVVLRSADLERAAKFYQLLGVEFSRERHGKGPEHLACQLGGVVLELYPADGESQMATVRLGLQVRSVDAAVAAVRDAGGTVLSNPKDTLRGRRAVLVDPDGHRVEVAEGSGEIP